MSTAPAQRTAPMTAEQLLELPDDGVRHELVEGELRTMVPAGVVDPQNRTVTVYRQDGVAVLRGADVLDGGDVLPGFALPLEELWR